MRAIKSDEMKKLEEYAIDIGIPSRVLMENAGESVASTIISLIKRAKRAVLVIGKGNNGGDGLVTARYLFKNGIKIDVFLVSQNSGLSSDCKANLDILEKMGISCPVLKDKNDLETLKDAIIKCDVLVDAIYGTGFKGKIDSITSDIIDVINDSKSKVKGKMQYQTVSIDCPSGADISTGEVSSPCVQADITVTFEYYKEGLLRYPASRHAGKIIVTDIGIPRPNPVDREPLWKKERIINKEKMEGIEVTDAQFVASVIPARRVDAHKGSCGKALIISGSPGMCGAAALCGQSALRVGAGLVVIGVPESIVNFVDSMSIETITWGLPETDDGTLSPKALEEILTRINEFDVIAIGPGLSANKGISELVEGLLSSDKIAIPVILDADALNSIDDVTILKRRKVKNVNITPHPGEMSRLIKKSIEEIQENRIKAASELAVDTGVNVVLKGAYTVVASPDGRLFINPTGSPAMASAGVGDVLTGALAGLMAQGIDALDALVAGVYIHGMCGNVVAGIKGERGIVASDLLDSLPFVISSIIKSS